MGTKAGPPEFPVLDPGDAGAFMSTISPTETDQHGTKGREAALIVNAHARQGEAAFEQARRLIAEKGIRLIHAVAVTQGASVEERTRELTEAGCRFVILGGGDGTITSSCGNFADRDVTLGVLPLGTANSFARSLGIPLDLPGAVDVLVEGAPRQVDLGIINHRYHFANGSSIGLPATVDRKTSGELKRYLGRAGYLVVAVRRFMDYQPFRCTITADGRTIRCKAVDIRIANGPYQGGVLVAEEADVASGEIVVHVVKGHSRWLVVREWVRVASGAGLPAVAREVIHGRDIRIETRPRQDVALDGDVVTRTPITVSVAPRALKVMAPGNSSGRGA